MTASTWSPKFEGRSNAGLPLPLGQLFTYAAGTTTPLATYTDQSGATPNANPVVLDAAGRANVWLAPNVLYKLILKDVLGVTIWTQDNFSVADAAYAPSFAAALAASTGDSLVGHIATGTGAVATTLQEFARRKVWVADYLPAGWTALGLRDINCAPYIQAAINAASPPYGPGTGAGDVIFPDGVAMRVDTTLNCTNSRGTGTPSRDGLHLVGNGVRLLGNTGAGKAIIEVTGSQFLEIDKGITLVTLWALSALPTKSTFGIFSGVSVALPQTQNQRIACRIEMHSDPAANGGVGTIAYYNFGSEENTYDNVYWFANVAAILTSSNDGTQYGNITYTSYQAPLLTVHSLGVATFAGECFLCGINLRNSPLILQNITGLSGGSLYISDVDPQLGSNIYAVQVHGNSVAMNVKVTIEQYSSVLFRGSVINSDMDLIWGGVVSTASPAIALLRTSANGIKNSRIKVSLQANIARPIVDTDDADRTTASSYYLQNVEFIADALGAPNLTLPPNVMANAASLKVKTTGANLDAYQPVFAATYSGDQANVTGDATVFNLSAYTMTAQINANNSLVSGNGKFIAPQNGAYEFSTLLRLFGITGSHTNAELYLVAGGTAYLLQRINPVPLVIGNTVFLQGCRKVPMLAGQEAFLRIIVAGGTKVVSVGGGSVGGALDSYFEGAAVH